MIFSDGKRSCVVRIGARGRRPLRAEPVDADAAQRRESRPGRTRHGGARPVKRPL
jgi:hypothetical protein